MRFHFHPASYNARRALAVAYHLELPIEVVVCDLMSGAQQAPAFLALNPNGRVPVLEDGGFTLWETMAITQYLAAQTPNTLWPDDPRARADITRWQAWDLAHFGRAADVLLFENRLRGMFGLGPPNEVAVRQAEVDFRKYAGILDAHLASRPYVTGASLTLADFSLAGAYESAVGAAAPAADFPHVARWYATIRALPAWARAASA